MTNQIRDGLEPCPNDPTQFGDDVAAEMRAYFEAHKGDRRKSGTADNLMLGLYNIVARAMPRTEADQSSLDTMEGRIEELADKLDEAHAAMRWVYENGMIPDPLRPKSVSDAFSDAYAKVRALRGTSHDRP